MGAVNPSKLALNTTPCNQDDNASNAQIQQTINNNVTNILQNGGGGGDTFKVAVNATDAGNATADYLHAKINDTGAYSADTSAVARAETISDLKERLFWDAQDITGYAADKILSLDGDGHLAWSDPSGATDTFKVLISASDTTPKYLHAATKDNATYVGGADIIVATMIDGAPSSSQHERFFLDVSEITGWDATALRVLGIVGNVSTYFTVGDLSGIDTYTVKVTSGDTTPSYLHAAVHTNGTIVSSEDAIIASQTIGASSTNQTEEWFLDSSAIAGYSDIPDGSTWPLALIRSDSTYTLKWASVCVLRWARVIVEIGPATGPLFAAWGTGQVKLQDPNTGALSGTATTVYNQWIGDISTRYPVDAQALIDIGQDPPRVVNGTCGFVTGWE